MAARFNYECLAITPLALWDIMSLKQKDSHQTYVNLKEGGP
jgi:hypothetical protein